MAIEVASGSSPAHSGQSVTMQAILLIAAIAAVLVLALSINLETPYLGYATASAFLFHVRVKPGWKQLLLAVLLGVALGSFRLMIVGVPSDINGFKGAMLGLGSVMVLAILAATSTGVNRSHQLAVLGPALGFMLFMFIAQRGLTFGETLYPKTYDLYLYAFDGSFGFQASFVLSRLFHASVLVRDIGFLTYQTLPLAMALVYAGYIDAHATKPVWYLFKLFLAAGLLGMFFYNFLPAAGPAYAFLGTFPYRVVPLTQLSAPLPRIVVGAVFPRNAIPSMHMAWALLAWWNCRPFSRWFRAAFFLYLLLTIIATLGTGEHYLVDLLTAVPFAVMIEALCQSSLPLKSRRVPFLAGLLITMAWLLLARFGTALVLKSPIIPWVLAILSTFFALGIERRLAADFLRGTTSVVPRSC